MPSTLKYKWICTWEGWSLIFMDLLLLGCIVRAAHTTVYHTPFYYNFTQLQGTPTYCTAWSEVYDESSHEIPAPAFRCIIWKEKGELNSPAMTAILHHCFGDSSQLWDTCSTAVICQRIGGILFVTFMFPTSRTKTNEYMLGSFRVMGDTDLWFGHPIPSGVRQTI